MDLTAEEYFSLLKEQEREYCELLSKTIPLTPVQIRTIRSLSRIEKLNRKEITFWCVSKLTQKRNQRRYRTSEGRIVRPQAHYQEMLNYLASVPEENYKKLVQGLFPTV